MALVALLALFVLVGSASGSVVIGVSTTSVSAVGSLVSNTLRVWSLAQINALHECYFLCDHECDADVDKYPRWNVDCHWDRHWRMVGRCGWCMRLLHASGFVTSAGRSVCG